MLSKITIEKLLAKRKNVDKKEKNDKDKKRGMIVKNSSYEVH
jgi:hypothetical protein